MQIGNRVKARWLEENVQHNNSPEPNLVLFEPNHPSIFVSNALVC